MIRSGRLRRSARLAARRQRMRQGPHKSITDLPENLRQMIVRELIHAVKGPEVYVGRGSRIPVMMEPIRDTRELPRFHSSVTDTIEIGLPRDYSHLPDDHEQSWAQAYGKLRPLMACKRFYKEATTIFFQEKHFVLGSKHPPKLSSYIHSLWIAKTPAEARRWAVLGGLKPRGQFTKSWAHSRNNFNSTDKRFKGSTYAHEWLRRIGWRNQVNLRNIRLKIHEELTVTGDLNTSGSLWIEVLRKLARSSWNLRVLGFQYDDDFDLWRCPLLRSFLRMTSFTALDQIDFFHCLLPSRIRSEEFLDMIATSTGCAVVRCLELSDTEERRYRLIRERFRGIDGVLHFWERY